MHHVGHVDWDFSEPPAGYAGSAASYSSSSLVGSHTGAVHTDLSVSKLDLLDILDQQSPTLIIVVAGIAVGLGVGLVNGVIVTAFRINALIGNGFDAWSRLRQA